MSSGVHHTCVVAVICQMNICDSQRSGSLVHLEPRMRWLQTLCITLAYLTNGVFFGGRFHLVCMDAIQTRMKSLPVNFYRFGRLNTVFPLFNEAWNVIYIIMNNNNVFFWIPPFFVSVLMNAFHTLYFQRCLTTV